MEFITAEVTDVGVKRKINQDKLLIRRAEIEDKHIILSVICDGMGGLAKGEAAAAAVADKLSDCSLTKLRDGTASLI